jgi:hypothetical protein
MQTVLQALRELIGTPDFYLEGSGYSGSWDYGAMIEYFGALLLVLIVVSSVFRLIIHWANGK